MKIIKENFWDRIMNRMPANDADRARRVLKRAGCLEEIDYMSVKALSELVELYEREARLAIRTYRQWEVRENVYKFAASVRSREGHILRRDAQEKAGLYRDAKQDYLDLIELAMEPYRVEPANDADADSDFAERG